MISLLKSVGLLGVVLLLSLILSCLGKSESQLRIGKAINLFTRYGYLGISMKVISYNDSETWLFKEPTFNVFQGIEDLTIITDNDQPSVFNGDFHMEFCDNKRQLFQAYFRDFTIERLDRPWQAFTGGWHQEVAARKLGINSSYIKGDYCYILVRVSRFREIAKLKKDIPHNILLDNEVTRRIQNVTPGDTTSTVQFMSKYGTHYINSYTTGNSLYQVFVYTKHSYRHIKEHLKSRGVAGQYKADLYNYFSPWSAEHLGQIRAASGNMTVESWAHRNLRLSYYVFSYPSLVKLHGNANLLRNLDELLGNEAILQLSLKTLSVVYKEPEKRAWFQEIIDNYLKLWEVNL